MWDTANRVSRRSSLRAKALTTYCYTSEDAFIPTADIAGKAASD
jgi:hypothetical protein